MADLDIAALRKLLAIECFSREHRGYVLLANAHALLDAAEERDRLRAMKDAEWEAAKHRYCDLPVSADSLDTARAFVLRWFGATNKDQETDARELARMFDAVAKDATSERDALRAQRDALVAAGERLIRATLMDTNSGAGIRKGWVEVRESQWDALFDERAPLVTLIRSAKEQP